LRELGVPSRREPFDACNGQGRDAVEAGVGRGERFGDGA
jgi:hypothetical protein